MPAIVVPDLTEKVAKLKFLLRERRKAGRRKDRQQGIELTRLRRENRALRDELEQLRAGYEQVAVAAVRFDNLLKEFSCPTN